MRNEIAGKMGKKRKKGIEDIELERSLYNSFCTAANSVSQLYTQAQHQQKRAFAAGARTSTERILHWLTKEYSGSPQLPVEAIAAFLMKEVDRLDNDDAALSEQYQTIQQLPSTTAQATVNNPPRQPQAQAPAQVQAQAHATGVVGPAREGGHVSLQPCLVDHLGGAAGPAMPPPSVYGRRASNSGSGQSPRRSSSKHIPFGGVPGAHACDLGSSADAGGGMGGFPVGPQWVGLGHHAGAQEYRPSPAGCGDEAVGYSTGGGGGGGYHPGGYHDRISREDPGLDQQDGPEDIAMS